MFALTPPHVQTTSLLAYLQQVDSAAEKRKMAVSSTPAISAGGFGPGVARTHLYLVFVCPSGCCMSCRVHLFG